MGGGEWGGVCVGVFVGGGGTCCGTVLKSMLVCENYFVCLVSSSS